MHAFYASGGSYNHHQRVIFGRLQRSSEPVFWTSACCSFNWVTTDAKAHKSNFIMLSFGTSAQRGNTNRQLSEKWSFTIWHHHSNSLCLTLACREYCIWAGIQKVNRGSWLSIVLTKWEASKGLTGLSISQELGTFMKVLVIIIQTRFLQR